MEKKAGARGAVLSLDLGHHAVVREPVHQHHQILPLGHHSSAAQSPRQMETKNTRRLTALVLKCQVLLWSDCFAMVWLFFSTPG
jgi:hypothetical protein